MIIWFESFHKRIQLQIVHLIYAEYRKKIYDFFKHVPYCTYVAW